MAQLLELLQRSAARIVIDKFYFLSTMLKRQINEKEARRGA